MTHIKVLNNVLVCMNGDFFPIFKFGILELDISEDFLFLSLCLS